MKYYELDQEEQEILDALESGNFVSSANQQEEIEKAIQIAKNSSQKTRNINIRISEKTLYKLKAQAIKKGIPYQTLASSILHQTVVEDRPIKAQDA